MFFQGGATGQFAAIPLNLFNFKASSATSSSSSATASSSPSTPTAHYIVSGIWSKKAVEEAQKYLNVKIIANSSSSKFTSLPSAASVSADEPAPLYTYYCANETVNGAEYSGIPEGVHPVRLPLLT